MAEGSKASSSRAPTSPLEGTSEPPIKRSKPAVQQFPQRRRNGHGSMGKLAKLVTNHFAVSFDLPWVNHYTVSITTDPERPLRSNLHRKVMECVRETYDLKQFSFAYDGEKALFVAGELSFKSKVFPVTLMDRRNEGQIALPKRAEDERRAGNEFIVTLDFATKIDMKAAMAIANRGERDSRVQDALRVLEIMIREHGAKKKYILQRDCFYSLSFAPGVSLSGCVETWKGFHASFKSTIGGLSLNFDTATTVMVKSISVIAFMEEHCKKSARQFTDADYLHCKKVLKGLFVEDYLKRTHKVLGFSPLPCSSQTFPMKKRDENGELLDPEEISVEDYFTKLKARPLKLPQLRALDVGRPKKPTYFPLDICIIVPGQRYKRTMNTLQRQGMIKECKLNPDRRVTMVSTLMEKNDYDKDELLKDFGVHFSKKLTRLEGRVLDPPQLQFGKNHKEVPRNGRWNFSADRPMNQPASTGQWVLIWFKNRRTLKLDVKKIGNDLIDVGSKKGMKFGAFKLFEEADNDHQRMSPLQRVEKMIDRLRDEVKDRSGNPVPPDRWPFVFAILPEKSPDLYIPFKRICETKVGIVTQCVVPPNGRTDAKYLSSVCLKINLKLGGYNSILAREESKTLPKISKLPTIIIGLDVAHGSVGDGNAPSVAAGVATIEWPRFSRYICSIRAQQPKTERINGLYERNKEGRDIGMVRELLMGFYNHSAGRPMSERKPHQVLVYRDGVSESEFDNVLDQELRAFKDAFRGIAETYSPKITFVVVQKKHHTRFFLESNMGNVSPGTVVDKEVSHPRNNDFYLVSHAAIGTARPTHYHVLWDEIGFSADELQTITNGLCYTYSRCTSAVSVVAPAYYAHVAAGHCRNFVDSTDSGSGSESVRGSENLKGSLDALPKLHANVLPKMFYV